MPDRKNSPEESRGVPEDRTHPLRTMEEVDPDAPTVPLPTRPDLRGALDDAEGDVRYRTEDLEELDASDDEDEDELEDLGADIEEDESED